MKTVKSKHNVPKSNKAVLSAADPDGLYIEAIEDYPYMMTTVDVAEFLGQTRQAVSKYIRTGRLRGVRMGSVWRVPKKALLEFLYDSSTASR